MKTYYKLVWVYKDGREHSTFANTIEIAEAKAKTKIENKNIEYVAIEKIELEKVLKDEWY